MRVHPSRHQQRLLVALFLLLLWPVVSLIAPWQWVLVLPCWLLALWLGWRALRVPPFTLIWDGQWLQWQEGRYQLGHQSRILPGVLRLFLCPEQGEPCQLWLFADAVSGEHYRLLARIIDLLQPAPPR
ncbi:MAG: protein YgfX [Aeromonas sp.]